MTLRWRLSIALVLAVTLGAATFGLVARAVVQHQLYHDVDDALRTEVARLVGDLDGPSRDGPFARRGRRGGDGPGSFFGRNALFAQVIADDGTVISRTTAVDAIGGLPQPRLGDARDGELHLRTVRIDHERYRLAEARVADGATVQVARPLTELAGFLDTLLRVLVAAGGLAIGAALLLGPWAARATLRPVERMTRTAQSIANEPHDLSARVEPAFPDPELREFADAINEMLASIEDADRHQRRFVADASHELRTPLTSLGGNASWLAARESLDRDEREAIESVGRDVARLVRIADGLTVLARLDAAPAPQLEPVDVDAAVRESIDRARRVHPDHSFEADELGCGTQVLDAELVRRILDNLLDN
ncbi:MAG: HAMP domain-containing protein, partial [Thermoleophilia bacterium]|nr:HAMP domain-containing protein [Thermoleophilia bacterium]